MFALRFLNEIVLSIVFVGFLGHARPLSAKALEHRYSSWIETSDLASCQQKLDGLARRFTLYFGVDVVQKRCGEIVKGNDDLGSPKLRSLSLIYRSIRPVSLTSVQFGTDSSETTPGTFMGAFSQLQQCQDAVSSLGKQFSDQTQGPVIDSYCLKGRSLFDENRGGYVLHILGAPNPRESVRKFYVAGVRPYSSFGKVPQEIEDDIVSRIRKQGGTIAKVARGIVWYYAIDPAAIKIWPVTGIENKAFCQLQKENFVRSLGRLGTESSPSFYCLHGSGPASPFKGGLAIWNGRRTADLSMQPLETYSSSDECLDDLGRLYRNWLGSNSMDDIFKETIGIVCVASTGLPKANEIYEAKSIQTWR